jgi:AraC-like DNA-binding protein
MTELTFTDGFTALFLLQSLIVGVLLLSDVTTQNRFLGAFVIIYAANSSRILLYKLAGQSALLDLYVGLSWAGFFMPLLYFFLKSHVEEIDKKSLSYHSITPFLLLLFSGGYSSNQVLKDLCSSELYNLITYSVISVLCLVYSFLSFRIITQNPLWKEILKSVRLKVSVFVFSLLGYLFFISIRILISLIFDISSSPDDPLYLIQSFLFYVVFAFIPFYTYTLLSRFKKFIQPRNVSSGKSLPGDDLKGQLEKLFGTQKIHTKSDLSPNTLANILDVPVKYLRIYFKNHFRSSIPDYIAEKRLEEFIELAKKDTNNIYNIEGIAMNAGFKSRPTFYRAFKNKYGVTPADYLKEKAVID